MLNKKAVITTFATLSLLLLTVSVILNDIPCRDMASRYAPMAEAFAAGEWSYAFHPRIQPLQIVSGGIIAKLFGCDGFSALKIAAGLWFFAGMYVVWKLFREVYADDPSIASGATAFYAIYPYNIRMAAEGLRESSKTFLLLLTAWALVKIYKNIKERTGYVLLGIGCSLALICRADTIMTGIFLLFTGLVLECRENKFPKLSFIPLTITGIMAVLCSLLNYSVSGHAMADYRFAVLFVKASGHPATVTDAILITIISGAMLTAAAILTGRLLRKIHAGIFVAAAGLFTVLLSFITGFNDTRNRFGEFAESLFGGMGNMVGLVCLAVIIYLIRNKKFTGSEFMLCLVVLANAFFNIVPLQLFHKTLYVSDRYLYTALPLLAGFFVLGLDIIYRYCCKKTEEKRAKSVLKIACTVIAVAFISAAMQPQLRNYTAKKDVAVRKGTIELADAIKKDYRGEQYRANNQTLNKYYSCKAPFVLWDTEKKICVASYMAGGSSVYDVNDEPDYFVGDKLPEKLTGKAQEITGINFGKYHKTLWRITR